MGVVSSIVAEKCSAFVIQVGHRSAAEPGCHFPAQLQDAITTYSHLLNQGFKPANIIFSGDSSGGHLAFNLLRYLLENPSAQLPKPAVVLICSPWVDLVTDDYTAYHD